MGSPGDADGVRAAIDAIEAQRPVLGDAATDAATAPLRARLAELAGRPTTPPPAVSRRRQATVMFADLSGYTTLSERIDPESVRLMLIDLWAAIDAIITSHRGTVVQHMADGAMAIWSGDLSQEDDAEVAVRAALEAVAWVDAHGVELGDTHLPAQMSVGIHTGPVNIGLVGTTDELTAIGDTVNVAARLEGVASAGEVVMSRATYHQVRGIFDVTDAGSLALKGRATPVQAYRVIGLRPRAFRTRRRGVEGLDTTMTGRDAELGVLTTRHRELVELGHSAVVTVVGEPGIGKSRLLSEYRDWIDLSTHPVRYFEGRCVPDDIERPYSLLRDIFMHRFEITDSDAVADRADAFATGIDSLLGPGSAQAFEGAARLTGLDSSAAGRAMSPAEHHDDRSASLELLRRLPGRGRAVMFLEDLHWADAASLLLLGELITQESPGWLIVATARPEHRDAVTAWTTPLHLAERHDVVRLDSLDQHGVLQLVDDVLRLVADVPPELRALIAERADGNPLFVEEFIKMLVDDHVIVPGEHWVVHLDRLRPGRVPDTLTGILQSRLDHLHPQERRTLQLASVFGRYFWDTAIADLADRPLVDTAAALKTLLATELVHRRRPSRFARADEFGFQHDVTRAVTYDTLSLGERAPLHRAAARWLEAMSDGLHDELAVPIGRHLDAAGDRPDAGVWYRRAAQRTMGRGAYAEAIELFDLAIDRAPTDSEEHVATRLEQTYALVVVGSFDDAKERLHHLRDDADARGDTRLAMTVAGELARISMLRDGNFEEAQLLLDAALRLTDPGAHLDEELALRHQLTNLAIVDGRWQDACDQAQAILEHSDLIQPRQRGLTLNTLAHAHAQLGHYERAVELADAVAALADELADRRLAMAALAQRALAAQRTGRLDEASSYFRKAQDLNRRDGDREKEATVANYLGEVAFLDGRIRAAAAEFAHALRLGQEYSVINEVVRAVVGGAAVAASSGDLDRAARLLAACDGHAAATGQARELSAWLRTTFELPEPTGAQAAHDVDFAAIVGEARATLEQELARTTADETTALPTARTTAR